MARNNPWIRTCAVCRRPATFLTPVGLMCPDHALLAALNQPAVGDQWMPIRTRRTEALDGSPEEIGSREL